MDFPIHIYTISMVLSIEYFKGSQVEFSKKNSEDPAEMQHHAAFQKGLHVF